MKHIGRETKIKAGDKTYILSRWTRGIWRDFMDWAETKLPNPIAAIKDQLDGFPVHIQELLVKEALQAARQVKSITSPEVQGLLHSVEGMAYLFSILLKENHKDVTEDDAWDIFNTVVAEHGTDYLIEKFNEANGELEKKVTAT